MRTESDISSVYNPNKKVAPKGMSALGHTTVFPREDNLYMSKESIPYQAFFQQAAQAFGGSVPKKSLPNGLISWGFPILKMLARVVGKNLPMTASVARNAQRKTRYSNQKVERYLQFRYRELQDTLSWAKTQE